MKILFTSAGRRKYLIDYFEQENEFQLELHIGNSDPLCSAFATQNAFKIVTPPICSDEYLPFLLAYCRQYSIDAIISLFDADLPVLAKSRSSFSEVGTRVIVADTGAITACNDKWETVKFLQKCGLKFPATFIDIRDALMGVETGSVVFPLILKPRWGMGSIGLKTARDRNELEHAYQVIQGEIASSYLRFESAADQEASILIQETLEGQEYGLDVINDLEGNHVMTSVKRKLAMRAGETDIAVTEDVLQLRELGGKIATALRHPGNLDVDVFWDGKTARVLEMNARFGGGYPFSHMAGVNLPRAILFWLSGQDAPSNCFDWKPGIRGAKALIPVQF